MMPENRGFQALESRVIQKDLCTFCGVLMFINTRPIYAIDVIAGNTSYQGSSVVLEKIQRLSRKVWTLNATEVGRLWQANMCLTPLSGFWEYYSPKDDRGTKCCDFSRKKLGLEKVDCFEKPVRMTFVSP